MQFGGPEILKLEEVATPKPSAGEVLVRIHAAGVNPYDTYMRAGTYALKPKLPYTPGSDRARVVEAVGEGVKSETIAYTRRGPSLGHLRNTHSRSKSKSIRSPRTLISSRAQESGYPMDRISCAISLDESTRFRNRASPRRKRWCGHLGAPNRAPWV